MLGYNVVFAPQSICYHVHAGTASSLPPPKVQYLYERNALYTILKNYEALFDLGNLLELGQKGVLQGGDSPQLNQLLEIERSIQTLRSELIELWAVASL